MMRKVVSLAVILSTTLAYADPRHIMVLKTDGSADAPTRAKVDAAVLRLAKTLDGQVSPGDISFDDATAMVGCKPEAQSCKDDVLATLAVDEVVMTTATRKPGTLEVTVHRIAKGTTHDATVRVSPDGDPQLDGLAALFGTQAPAPVDKPPTPPPVDQPVDQPPPPVDQPPPVTDQPKDVVPLAQPAQPVVVDEQHNRLEYAGMIGGGASVLLAFIFWGAANSTQDQINSAPTKTKQNIMDLQALEKTGDGQAGAGNLFFVAGIVVGALGGYYFWRDHHRHAQVAPAVFDHGAGVSLVIGGFP
jgi:outer membrane biosynthesis protein TonB